MDPDVGASDGGNFLFLNLATAEAKFKIPPNTRRRVDREKMRNLLLRGVQDHVHWSKKLVGIQTSGDQVTAIFQDGASATGSLLVGVEGARSRTRAYLRPHGHENTALPVRAVGVVMRLTEEQVAPLRALDPLLFQGAHPDTGTFLWFSILSVPASDGAADGSLPLYRVQLILSWPAKQPSDEIPASNAARLQQMREKADGFAPVFHRAVHLVTEETPVVELQLADWLCEDWDNRNGTVTLAGDAAHAMTMYRGEAANHGIMDAHQLSRALEAERDGRRTKKQALDAYETEMRERTRPAVLLSREACLGAHDFNSLNQDSAVLRRRAITAVDTVQS